MSDVLKLVLKDSVARPGEKFSCVVLLAPNDERVSTAAGLMVRLEWRASYGGLRGESQTVAKWSPDLPLRMEYIVPFELPADAPITYAGKLVRIDWAVIAELDVPWKKDPAVIESLQVLPRGVRHRSSEEPAAAR